MPAFRIAFLAAFAASAMAAPTAAGERDATRTYKASSVSMDGQMPGPKRFGDRGKHMLAPMITGSVAKPLPDDRDAARKVRRPGAGQSVIWNGRD